MQIDFEWIECVRLSSVRLGNLPRGKLSTNELLEQKLDYIHNNPVEAGFVTNAEDWIYSSAKDYCGLGKGMLDIILVE